MVMGGIGIWQILIVALVVLVLFGRGRISEMMGDFGKGISSFKKGMSEEEASSAAPTAKARIEPPAGETGEPVEAKAAETSAETPGRKAG